MAPFDTNPATGLTQIEASDRHKVYGFNIIVEKKVNHILLLLKKFSGLSAWMLELIILLSLFLHKYSDAGIVLTLLIFNAIIGFAQQANAARAVDALKKKLQVMVKLLRSGNWNTVAARELVPGDIIRVRNGDFVPADVKIIAGEIYVDQSALTGESAEVNKKEQELVYSGSVVTKGEVSALVTAIAADTFYGKTIELVKTATFKSHVDEVITGVVKWLLAIVSVLLALAVFITWLRGIPLIEILPLLLVLLLGAIPVALSAMFTVSMALGAKTLVNQGVLITRLNAPDDAARMDILCVDKTGTLTENKLSVAKILSADGFAENDVVLYGALASQEANHDPIDQAFIDAAKLNGYGIETYVQKTFIPFDPKTRKTEATIIKGTEQFIVMKGAFASIAKDCELKEGSISAWAQKIEVLAKAGYRTLAVAKADMSGRPTLVGLAALFDPPRIDSKKVIAEIEQLGIQVKMLTGDARPVAVELAKAVGIGNRIIKASELQQAYDTSPETGIGNFDGVAEVYPVDKYQIVKRFQEKGHVVGMTGDGVNDAPALRQAEVGIAVNNASDVAKGAASMVLTVEGLSPVVAPVITGRMMFERIKTWVLNKIARTILKTCFVVGAFLILGKYVISASAMLIMIFMTDFVKISLATDNVKYAREPAKWNITGLAKVGIIIGLLMVLEAFGLLYIGLYYFKLNENNGALSSFSFEILLFFALFSIFVVREKKHFWSSRPGSILLLIIAADMVLGIVLASFGVLGFTVIPLRQSLTVIIYTAFFSLVVNDFFKFLLLRKEQTHPPITQK